MQMRLHPRVIGGDELAAALGVSPGEFERIAALAQLQINYSQSALRAVDQTRPIRVRTH
jgi:hypothetical protein